MVVSLSDRGSPKIGVLLLNFGEPEETTEEVVVPFLERIFALNAPLMGGNPDPDAVRVHSHRLAVERAPGLIEEYRRIGGSPLHAQSREQAEALQTELTRRGYDAVTFLGMQFTEPSIPGAITAARAAGVDFLVSIPVYPLCGPSTNVAALKGVDAALEAEGWSVPAAQVTGWHRHPAYVELRADAIRRLLAREGLSLADPRTRLVFSAHGTPMRYIRDGSRYEAYVKEFCAGLAAAVGASSYEIGYQNHTNRPGVEWTQPDIEKVIDGIDADRVIVDAVSFMHEQSETLAELDGDLREEATARGLEFHRVPIPHRAPEFISLLADLVESALRAQTGSPAMGPIALRRCRCKPDGAMCTNGVEAVHA